MCAEPVESKVTVTRKGLANFLIECDKNGCAFMVERVRLFKNLISSSHTRAVLVFMSKKCLWSFAAGPSANLITLSTRSER